MAGGRRLVLLGGEPGVGKTRLAAELAGAVHDDGATVLAGRCDEDLGVPYQPFVEALRHYVDHASPSARALGRYGGELVRLRPRARRARRRPGRAAASDPETERYRLFDAVAAWLARRLGRGARPPRARRPAVGGQADAPAAAPRRPLGRAAAAARGRHLPGHRDRPRPSAGRAAGRPPPPRAARSGWSSAGSTSRPWRRSWSRPPATTSATRPRALARAVWRETEGNPFFVPEVLRHLTETGALEQRDGRWVVRAAIERARDPRRGAGRRRPAAVPPLRDTNRVLGRGGGGRAGVRPRGAWPSWAGSPRTTSSPPSRRRSPPGWWSRCRRDRAPRPLRPRPGAGHALRRAHRGPAGGAPPAGGRSDRGRSSPAASTTTSPPWPTTGPRPRRRRPSASRAVDYARRAGDRALAQLAHDEAAAYYRQALELLDAAGRTGRRAPGATCSSPSGRRSGEPATRVPGDAARRSGPGPATRRRRRPGPGRAGQLPGALRHLQRRLRRRTGRGPGSGPRRAARRRQRRRARLLAILAVEQIYAVDAAAAMATSDEAVAMARRLGPSRDARRRPDLPDARALRPRPSPRAAGPRRRGPGPGRTPRAEVGSTPTGSATSGRPARRNRGSRPRRGRQRTAGRGTRPAHPAVVGDHAPGEPGADRRPAGAQRGARHPGPGDRAGRRASATPRSSSSGSCSSSASIRAGWARSPRPGSG